MHLATGTGNRGGAYGTCADLRHRDLPEYTIHHTWSNLKVNIIIEIERIPAHLLGTIHGKTLILSVISGHLTYLDTEYLPRSFLIIRYCT